MSTYSSVGSDQTSVEPLHHGVAVLVLRLVLFELFDLARRELAQFAGNLSNGEPVVVLYRQVRVPVFDPGPAVTRRGDRRVERTHVGPERSFDHRLHGLPLPL